LNYWNDNFAQFDNHLSDWAKPKSVIAIK
jgi:hypothetical protein